MNIFSVKNKIIGASVMAIGLLSGCTDLDETYYSEVAPNNADASVVVDGVIGKLRGLETTNGPSWIASEYVYFLEASTDEVIVPTRLLKDWYDGGNM